MPKRPILVDERKPTNWNAERDEEKKTGRNGGPQVAERVERDEIYNSVPIA